MTRSKKAGTTVTAAIVAVVAIVALPFLLPWTYRARGEFTVEAAPPAPIRAQVDGILDEEAWTLSNAAGDFWQV